MAELLKLLGQLPPEGLIVLLVLTPLGLLAWASVSTAAVWYQTKRLEAERAALTECHHKELERTSQEAQAKSAQYEKAVTVIALATEQLRRVEERLANGGTHDAVE